MWLGRQVLREQKICLSFTRVLLLTLKRLDPLGGKATTISPAIVRRTALGQTHAMVIMWQPWRKASADVRWLIPAVGDTLGQAGTPFTAYDL